MWWKNCPTEWIQSWEMAGSIFPVVNGSGSCWPEYLLGNPKLIVMDNALPYLTTDLTDSEILSLAYRLLPLASSISISSHTVPASDCYYSANIRGMSVLVPDLPLIRQRLEEYLPLE